MTKHTMELVWHSCDDCPPKEDYNACLYVTNGRFVYQVQWERSLGMQRFYDGSWVILRGFNSAGWWWADLKQTVQGFAPIQKSV